MNNLAKSITSLLASYAAITSAIISLVSGEIDAAAILAVSWICFLVLSYLYHKSI